MNDRRSPPADRRDPPGRTEFDALEAEHNAAERWRQDTELWRSDVTSKLEFVAAQCDRLAVAHKRNSEGLERALNELKFNTQTTQRIEASTSDLVIAAKNLSGFANTCTWAAKWVAAPITLLTLLFGAFAWLTKNFP